ncbi:MAG: ribonuclease R [Saprospiraceae bacterium]|nr:ribonuclease R [Saprospiraceae bacterium]
MVKTNKVKGNKLPAKKLEFILAKALERQPKKRLNAKQLIKKLKIKNTRDSVEAVLERLAEKGKIQNVKDDKYRWLRHQSNDVQEPTEAYDGYVDLTRSGAGYIICEGLDQDIYVSAKRLKLAMNGDKVRVQLTSRRGRKPEGKVVKILERSQEKFIGDFQQNKNFAFVIPDDRMTPFDIIVYPKEQGNAKDTDKVMVEIAQWPERVNQSPIGRVTKVLDKTDRHGVMMQSILVNHGFDISFQKVVEQEAAKLSRIISQEEVDRRRDFRETVTLTIDPATAKDFDDALSIDFLDDGHVQVGVHIADVTHYVKPGTQLDKEAYKRATSVYLVDRVAPMLPEILSNELCSLRPNEDSLTFSAVFDFDQNFNIIKRWFGKGIIHSDRRFSYEEAQASIDGSSGDLAKELQALNKLSKILRDRRLNEGSIAFESPEVQFELNELNHPISIFTKERMDTHKLVEDLMLLANREVAMFIKKKEELEIPFVYRIHDQPDEQKLEEYALFLKELGFQFDLQSPRKIKESFNRLSEEARKDEVLAFAEPFAVRTMSKAIYSTENIGHFGLGFDHYSHFTSPIRRYADVLVHRILEKNLNAIARLDKSDLERMCRHISNQERKAQEAERESIKFKQVEYIAERIGQVFIGIVSGMIERGLFISLKETQIDGLIGFDTMSEPFDVAENRMKAIGQHSAQVIKIGQEIKVKIVDVNIDDLEVDMEIADGEGLD